MTDVLFLGTVQPFGNKGDEAIYITSIKLVRKYLPKVRTILASPEFCPTYKKLKEYSADRIVRHPMGALSEIFVDRIPYGSVLEHIIKSVYYHTPSYISALALKVLPLESRKCLENADAYIILSHPLEIEGFPTYIASFNIPRYFNPKKPIIAFPLSISTKILHDYKRRFLVKRSLSKASIVFTRGERTTEYLGDFLKLKNTMTSFDPSITLPKIEPQAKPSGGIAITPAGSALPPNLLARLTDALIEKLGLHCLIVPTSTEDIGIAYKLFSFVRNKHLCSIVKTQSMSPYEVKGFLSHVDVLITSRVHAAIFTLSECIPTVAMLREDDIKFYDVLGTFGLNSYIFDFRVDPKSTLDKIVDAVSTLVNNRLQVVNTIKKRLPLAIKRAEIPGSILRKLLIHN